MIDYNEDINLAGTCRRGALMTQTSRVSELEPLTWSTANAQAILVTQIVSVLATRKQACLLTGERGTK